MFCKYCGSKLANDSIFCVHCGKNITEDSPATPKVTEEDKTPVRIQLVNADNPQWKSTDNLQWVKPISAGIFQVFLLIIGLFFLCYGIVWECIIDEKIDRAGNSSNYPYFDDFVVFASESLGIINVCADLKSDNTDYYAYKSEWESLYEEKYYGNDHNPVVRALAYDDFSKYYSITERMAASKFRTHAIFIFILPALILIILSIIWIVRVTPKATSKTILPRDLADKIENYTWSGFTLHKYIRYIKNDKYGILDAANRSITVPATFELIEWREKNKSYDGVLDGVRKTYFLTNN